MESTKLNGWREIEPTTPMRFFAPHTKAYVKGGSRVLIGHEDRNGKPRWHLSISRADRYPGWDEIRDARYSLVPLGICMAMLLPPPNEYVDIHPNCFHLWEIDDAGPTVIQRE